MALDTVLFAVGEDHSDRQPITDTVIDVAGPAEATVVLGQVYSEREFDRVIGQLDYNPSAETDASEIAQRHTEVQRIASRLEKGGISPEIHGAVGEAAERIVGMADNLEADMVFIGGKRRSPTGKAVFGSTAQQILLNSSCPVSYVKSP